MKADENGEVGTLYIAGGNVKWYTWYGKVGQLLKKPNMELPYDPVSTLLDSDTCCGSVYSCVTCIT